MNDIELAPSEFVALLNQTLEYAYPSAVVQGELANFRVSKNQWVYFDLKDELATVRFFGTVYQLPGPLQDGMLLKVRGQPRLHPQYGFSVTVQAITPTGEGSIKKAAQLLEAKLAGEGLFDSARKRSLPYPPTHVGLITSSESAAYRDFVKILDARWGGIRITLVDVQVQGEAAPGQITRAIMQCNQMADAPDALVVTRGGGSAEDLQTFSTEQITRAVAASRIPILVAIGHEVDSSLAELAADQRASTPSNAAEMLVPDRKHVAARLHEQQGYLKHYISATIDAQHRKNTNFRQALRDAVTASVRGTSKKWTAQKRLLQALDPQAALYRGYAIIRKQGQAMRRGTQMRVGDKIVVEMVDADLQVAVQQIQKRKVLLYAQK